MLTRPGDLIRDKVQHFIAAKPSIMSAFDLVLLLVKKELKVKYRGTLLGYLWSMLSPLLMMSIISFVFSHLVRGIEFYSLYVLSGLLIWNMGFMALQIGSLSIVTASPLIRKVRVRMWVFPMVSVGSAIVNMILSLIPYLILYAIWADRLPTHWYYLPVVIILFFIFIAGLTLCVSVLSVFFRDVAHVLDPLLSLTFYATPIIYSREVMNIPENVGMFLALNPFVHFVESFRATAYPGEVSLSLEKLGLLAAVSLTSAVVGLAVYRINRAKIKFLL